MDSEVDDYEPTDSEQELDDEERELLDDLRKQRKKKAEKLNQKQEILAFSESDDDEDDVDELMRDSDIEGADDNGDLPDTMDWGSNKKTYYNTDFVDPDYDSYNAQEEDLAKAEEEEAKKIQLRLAKQLNEADFELDTFDQLDEPSSGKNDKKQKTNTPREAIKVSTDLSGLTVRERLQLLQKDSPEFIGVSQDFQRHLEDVQQLTAPVVNYVRNHGVPMVPALQLATLYQNVLLTYCSNVSFYLLLKAKRNMVKIHPVIKRLVQLKKLRDELSPRYEEFIRPQLEALLERIRDGDAFTVLDVAQRKAKLQILNQYDEPEDKKKSQAQNGNAFGGETDDDDDDDDDDQDDNDVNEAALELQEENEEEDEEEEDARRGITRQIAKNKGLTPHRKKEVRNPRVKHRGKFRKALIRRKGAVRTVRKEVKRYGGEISGIKSSVTKSVKFRT